MTANKNIFERIGPVSSARHSNNFDDEETAAVWSELSKTVIVPNNMRVCEIIQKKFHLRDNSDEEGIYLEFVTHSHAYKVFKDNTYEAYKLFPYPKEVLGVAQKTRDNLRKKLQLSYPQKKKGFLSWLCSMLF